MSGKVVGHVFDLNLPMKPKMVLLKYADNANEEGRNAFPSVKTVATKCSMSARTVRRIVNGLKHLGILEIDGKGYGGRKDRPRGQCYRINLSRARQIDGDAWAVAYREANDWSKTLATSVDNVSEPERCPLGDKPCPPEWPQTLSTTVDDKPPLTSIEPRARAAPSQAPALPRGRPSVKKPAETSSPANVVWNDCSARIEATCGEKAWKAWLRLLMPHADDGDTLHLAAPSKIIAEIVKRDYAQKISRATGRKIEITVRPYASPAVRERKGSAASADALS